MIVELVQGGYSLLDKGHNQRVILNRIERSSADLIVFGELFLTGYSVGDMVKNVAETIEGETMNRICEGAREKKKALIFGAVEEDSDLRGVYYNSAIVVDGDGVIDSYRKISLPNFGSFNEKRIFKEGCETRIFDLGDMRVGVLICYDLFFPELSRSLLGADVLIYISASPFASRSSFEKMLPARAIENSCYVVYVNLAGREHSMLFWGGSRVIDPTGKELLKLRYLEKDTGSLEIDPTTLRWFRFQRPVLRNAWSLGH